MYGTLAGALAGRKIPYDRTTFTATVDGRIVGIGKTIKIESMTVHYRLSVPPEAREAAARARVRVTKRERGDGRLQPAARPASAGRDVLSRTLVTVLQRRAGSSTASAPRDHGARRHARGDLAPAPRAQP